MYVYQIVYFEHIRHGYKKLSRHFGWALGKVFENDYEHVIVLEVREFHYEKKQHAVP